LLPKYIPSHRTMPVTYPSCGSLPDLSTLQ